MLGRRQRFRPRRLAPHRPRPGLLTEGLESRRLLAANPIAATANISVPSGLPLPGLATGLGLPTAPTLAATAVSVAPSSPSVAPVSVVPPSIPSATGPSPTLSPLMNDAETANAASSEVARPRPGLTDRISIILGPPAVLAPIAHLRLPDANEVIPGPEIELFAPAPVQPPMPLPAPVPAPAASVVPTASASPLIEKADAAAPLDPGTLTAWDAALAAVAADGTRNEPISWAEHTEAVLATGVLLAAWGGWKYGPRAEGRSRRHAQPIGVHGAAPAGIGR